MNKTIAIFASMGILLIYSPSAIADNLTCPYGGSPNWQGVCDTATDFGESYFGPPLTQEEADEIGPAPTPPPPPPPIDIEPPVLPPNFGGGSSIDQNSPIGNIGNTTNNANTQITGDNNSVSSVFNNTVVSTINNSVNNVLQNVVNNSNIIEVTGGYILISESGAAEFFPVPENESLTNSEDVLEINYIEKNDLPKSILKSVRRLPKGPNAGTSKRISFAIRNAESVTEDICLVEKRRIKFISSGTCVIEIPVGDNIYEHEINVL